MPLPVFMTVRKKSKQNNPYEAQVISPKASVKLEDTLLPYLSWGGAFLSLCFEKSFYAFVFAVRLFISILKLREDPLIAERGIIYTFCLSYSNVSLIGYLPCVIPCML